MRSILTLTVFSLLLPYSMNAFSLGENHAMRNSAPKGITDAFYKCTDRAGGDIVALGQCTTAEKRVQDARLNKAYSALMGKLGEGGKTHLREAERAWIVFNAKSVDTELDVRSDEKTANIDVSVNEIYRYADRASVLEGLLSIVSD